MSYLLTMKLTLEEMRQISVAISEREVAGR